MGTERSQIAQIGPKWLGERAKGGLGLRRGSAEEVSCTRAKQVRTCANRACTSARDFFWTSAPEPQMTCSIAISTAIYRGAKCLTLKTAEKGAEWVTVKQPKNSRKKAATAGKKPKHPENSQSAVFRLFSMLGIWHLCRWRRDRNCSTLP